MRRARIILLMVVVIVLASPILAGGGTQVIRGDTEINHYNSTNYNVSFLVGKRAFAYLQPWDEQTVFLHPFDINSSTNFSTDVLDWSNFSKNGSAFGTTWDEDGGLDSSAAFVFDGKTSTIQFNEFRPNEWNFTIYGRFKAENTSAGGTIISQLSGLGDFFNVSLNGQGFVEFAHSRDGGATECRVTSSVQGNDSQWHNFAAVRNDTNDCVIYVDKAGTVNRDRAEGGNQNTISVFPGELLRVGEYNNQYFFNGTIDELTIINRSISFSDFFTFRSNQTQFFFKEGKMDFFQNNLDFGTNSSVNITLWDCQNKFLNTTLRARINNGSWRNFTNCQVDDYNITNVGGLTSANFSLGFIGSFDPLSSTEGFASPVAIGNISFAPGGNFFEPEPIRLVNVSNLTSTAGLEWITLEWSPVEGRADFVQSDEDNSGDLFCVFVQDVDQTVFTNDFDQSLNTTDNVTFHDINNTGNATINLIYGELWNYSSNATAWLFTISTVDVYYNLTGLEEGELNGFTHAHKSQQEGGSNLTALVSGLYQVSYQISTEATFNSGLYSFAVVRNYDVNNNRNCYVRKEVAKDEAGILAGSCLMRLEAGDQVNMQIEDEEAPASSLRIQTVNLNLVMIGK